MPFDYGQVPVECKNEADKTGPNDVAWFGEKIRYSGARDGLLVTVAGLSGEKQSGGPEQIRKELAKGTRIVVITLEDICKLNDSSELLALFQARFTELRHREGYESI